MKTCPLVCSYVQGLKETEAPRNQFCEGHSNAMGLLWHKILYCFLQLPLSPTYRKALLKEENNQEGKKETRENYMKWKERKKKELRCKIGTDLNNHSSLNCYNGVLVMMTCTMSSLGSVTDLPQMPGPPSQLHQCLLYLNRILHSVIFQKEKSKFPHILPAFLHGLVEQRSSGRLQEITESFSINVLVRIYTLLIKHHWRKWSYLLQDFLALYWNIIWDAEATVFLVIYHSWVD